MLPLLAGAGLFAAAIAVSGETSCPSASDVQARVGALLPAGADDGRSGAAQAWLEGGQGQLKIALVRPDGAVAGERVIEGEHGCDELADAAAVVLAAWMSDERAAAHLPLGSIDPALAPPAVTSRPTPPPPLPPAPAAGAREPSGPALEIGAGAGAAVAGTVAPAGLLAASWAPAGGRLAARLAGVLTSTHEATLPGGSVRWSRWSLALGPEYRGSAGRLAIAPHASFTLGRLTAEGRGFPLPRAAASAVAGAEAGLRVATRRRGLRPFIEVNGTWWPGRAVVYQDPDGAERTLPAFELLLTLGVALAR
jgi:hypothetical protein